jgi:hypothetical protein
VSGKGDKPRPLSVPRDKYESEFDRIFGQRDSEAANPSRSCSDTKAQDGAEP